MAGAFRRLGGTTRVVVLDSLKEGVLTPDIYDPALNPLYRDVLAHYGVVPLPCRVGDPDRKGKVESGIGHTQKTPRHGLRFETLEEAGLSRSLGRRTDSRRFCHKSWETGSRSQFSCTWPGVLAAAVVEVRDAAARI